MTVHPVQFSKSDRIVPLLRREIKFIITSSHSQQKSKNILKSFFRGFLGFSQNAQENKKRPYYSYKVFIYIFIYP